MRKPARSVMLVLAGLLSLALLGLYVDRAERHGRLVNTNPDAYDQGAYLHFAAKMRASGYRYLTDGARGPAFPFLLSLVVAPETSDEEAFERGKQLAIGLSIALLAIVGAILVRRLAAVVAASVLVVAAFTVFLFRAAYVQPELSFYVALLGGFVLALETLAIPSARAGLITGGLLGVAHLLKPAVLPAVALLLVLLIVPRRTSRKCPGRCGSALGAAAALFVGFVAVIAPYARANKTVFGRYLYNVNSTFYVWYDSWDDVKAGTRDHGDRKGWPDMPAEELPGPRRYLREHGLEAIVARELAGLGTVARSAVGPQGYAKYAALGGAMAFLAMATRRRRATALLRRHLTGVAFAVLFGASYTVVYAWFGPINYGPRFALSLFLPHMYVCGWLLTRLVRWRLPADRPRAAALVALAATVGVVLWLWDLWSIVAHRVLVTPSGA